MLFFYLNLKNLNKNINNYFKYGEIIFFDETNIVIKN